MSSASSLSDFNPDQVVPVFKVDRADADSPPEDIVDPLGLYEHSYATPSATSEGGSPYLSQASEVDTHHSRDVSPDDDPVAQLMTLETAKSILDSANPMNSYDFRSYTLGPHKVYDVIRKSLDGQGEQILDPENQPETLKQACDIGRRFVAIHPAEKIALYTCLFHEIGSMEEQGRGWYKDSEPNAFEESPEAESEFASSDEETEYDHLMLSGTSVSNLKLKRMRDDGDEFEHRKRFIQ